METTETAKQPSLRHRIDDFLLTHFKVHGSGKQAKTAASLHEELMAEAAGKPAAKAQGETKPAESLATAERLSDKPHTGAPATEPKKP